MGEQAEIWPQFSTPVAFDALCFRNEVKYLKYKTCTDVRWEGKGRYGSFR